ncbi:MAG: TonB-dependent receptor [Bacteroidetes bacterium]|nr:TonB-dependent receptor [Bacteroidota bacterium]MBL6943450.1 TonB-dependent receptor [Bacteroidales bacterium]
MVKQLTTKLLVFAVVLLSSSLTVFAQGGAVTGTVSDAGDGTLLPGATIVVKGTIQGTVTDIDGKYTINVEPNQVLVFSYVGFASQEAFVQPNTVVNVALQSSAISLEGVVVIGYGVTKKKDATGSVTAISEGSFNKGVIVSPASLIAGKVAGVQISSDGGAPGTSSNIMIRGGSSLNASNSPLIVIDGIPLSNEGTGGSRSPLNSINPNDIETFTVLKDASATAIYGSRASNGVIIITTKKGEINRPLQINYTGKLSYYEIPKTIDLLSPAEFQQTITSRFPNRVDMLGTWTDPDGKSIPYTALPADHTGYTQTIHNTNWQDEIYSNTTGMDHALSATGAWKKLPYRFSLGYTDQNGILKTSQFQRTSVSAALTPTLLDDHLKVNFNINGSFINNTFANRGAIGSSIQMDPTKPVKSSDGSAGGYWAWLQNNGDPVTQGTTNPMSFINLTDDVSNVNRVYGNLQLDYKLHFLPDLHANLNLSYDQNNGSGTNKVPPYASWAFNSAQGGGRDNEYSNETKNELVDFYLNYIKEVPSIKSTFNVMGGYSLQHFYNSSTDYNSNVPVINDSSTQEYIRDTVINKGEYYLMSYFGRLNYTFNDRFLFTATVRADGTSRFGPDNRWGIFPAVAVGWKINEEAFLRDSKVVSLLKLRVGWGITGQQDIGGYYDYMGRYTYGNQFAMYPFGNTYNITLRPEGYNENLKWEETTTWNFGIDYAFSSDRIYGSIDVYERKTKDLLSWVPAVAGSNLSNYINRNVGELENKGIEFMINGKIISNEKMFWELGFNATYNKNEITELYDGASIPTGGIAGGVGNLIQEQAVGQPRNSFYVYEQVYDKNGMPIEGLYVDRNGDGVITTSDKYYYHDPNADFYFGISSNFSYKEWSFSFAGRANFGNYMYNNVQSENGWYNRMYRPEGPYISNIVASISSTNFESAQYFSDYYIQDASFFRMDNITLSYTFKKLLQNRLNLQLSATVNNAFVITNYDGIDPEVNNGIDNNVYPRTRAWMFGVNLLF